MGVGLTNWDSSFFDVSFDGPLSIGIDYFESISDQVISFEISEESYKWSNGTIQIQDTADHMTSFGLKMGTPIYVSWGYNMRNIAPKEILVSTDDPTQINYAGKVMMRKAMGFVREVSGSCTTDGQVIYNCGFTCMPYGDVTRKSKTFKAGNKGTVVREVLFGMKVNIMFVKFGKREMEPVMAGTSINQCGMSDFAFLNRCAREWGCMFRIGFNNLYQPVALFCRFDDDTMIQMFLAETMNVTGMSDLFEWKLGRANVKSYSWQRPSMETGTGDSVTIIQGPMGEPIYLHQIAQTETVMVHRLNEKFTSDREKEIINSGMSFSDKSARIKEMLTIDTMEELVGKRYFTEYAQTTAPQGIGLQADLEMIGHPFYTVPARVRFGAGFPDIFGAEGVKFYQNKVTHKIDRSGYSCTVHVVDAFTMSGGTLIG